MPPLSGWGRAARGRRDAARAARTLLLWSPIRSKKAATVVASVRTLLPRAALWLAIGGLLVLFGMATDGIRVAVVAIPAVIVALSWHQLSWPVRAVAVLGLLWLSLVQLGVGLGLGLAALLVAWLWLPMRVGAASGEDAAPPQPAGPEVTGPGPASSVHDHAASLPMSASLRRFAEQRRLSRDEVAMLASIRFSGEPPRTAARWQHIYNAIRLSRWLDEEDAG
ncbi:MAG TPA: hypothetical protein VFA46_00640 [Actinomycetes bacterium]|jgi:hypothetical protein|nr:hypothetical protein [Actinomycetes bacterium]